MTEVESYSNCGCLRGSLSQRPRNIQIVRAPDKRE